MSRCSTGWMFAPLFVLASISCSSPSETTATGTGAVTPIQGTAFNGYCNWSSAEATAPADAGDGLHVGPLRVYWNQAPAHGSTEFPSGMLILKSSEDADPTKRVIFAMAKVGGNYNAGGGVPNWEWYSLQDNGDCTVTVLWDGPVAPAGETYSGQTVGDCDGCHTQAKANDYVWDTALELSNF